MDCNTRGERPQSADGGRPRLDGDTPRALPTQTDVDALPGGGLVLKRGPGEKIIIYEGRRVLAEISVAAIDRGRSGARLRVRTPRTIGVDRAEVLERRRAEAERGRR